MQTEDWSRILRPRLSKGLIPSPSAPPGSFFEVLGGVFGRVKEVKISKKNPDLQTVDHTTIGS